MLNKKNLFLSAMLSANFMFALSLFADNPGEVVSSSEPVAEEVVTEAVTYR